MAIRPVDIILNSAVDLNKVNLFTKVQAYAVVWIEGSQNYHKLQSPRDGENRTNPSWNFPMTFVVEEAALLEGRLELKVQIRTDGTIKNKEIGLVTVQLRDFVRPTNDGRLQAGVADHVTRLVYKPSRKIKGTLNFSVMFGERIEVPIRPQPTAPLVFGPATATGMANPVYPTGAFFGRPPRPLPYPTPNFMTHAVSTALPPVILAEHTGSLLQMMGDPAYYDGGVAYEGDVGF